MERVSKQADTTRLKAKELPGGMDDSPSSQSVFGACVRGEPSHMLGSACVCHWSSSEHRLLTAEGECQSKQRSGYEHLSALEKLQFTVLF